jgi:hypothetical protein
MLAFENFLSICCTARVVGRDRLYVYVVNM